MLHSLSPDMLAHRKIPACFAVLALAFGALAACSREPETTSCYMSTVGNEGAARVITAMKRMLKNYVGVAPTALEDGSITNQLAPSKKILEELGRQREGKTSAGILAGTSDIISICITTSDTALPIKSGSVDIGPYIKVVDDSRQLPERFTYASEVGAILKLTSNRPVAGKSPADVPADLQYAAN